MGRGRGRHQSTQCHPLDATQTSDIPVSYDWWLSVAHRYDLRDVSRRQVRNLTGRYERNVMDSVSARSHVLLYCRSLRMRRHEWREHEESAT